MKYYPRLFATLPSWVFVCLMSLTAVQAAPPTFEFEGAVAETYKSASGDDLQIYIFNPPGHQPQSDRRPAIVFFFGGGWVGGTPQQFEQHCRYLASRGMVAMTADYRVKSRQNTGPRECVADGKSAVRWIRQNAQRLGIDPQRVAAGGGSAGGHVASATGMIEGYEEAGEETAASTKPDALVLFNPVYDNGPDGWGHDRVEDHWETFSPAHNITSDDPPAVVFLGTADPLIPVATARKFQAEMKAAGLKSELHLYEDQPHGFFNQSKGGQAVFLDTLRKMDTFLVELGYLSGQPTQEQLAAVLQPESDQAGAQRNQNAEREGRGTDKEATAENVRVAGKPNFVIIMADDLGYRDIGCYGSQVNPTPHIDRLAERGLKFTDYHSNGAVCSPTRAALVTGRYQQRSGIGGVVTAADHRHTGLAVEEKTFADVLAANGYATAIYGKWHLGYAPRFNPIHNGFENFVGYVSGNVDFFSHIDQAGYADWWHQDQLTPEEGYTTHLITQYGLQFIERHRAEPFCLYLPHEAPHYPYQGPADTPIRKEGSVKKLAGERTDIANAYREMIVEVDRGVGQIVAKLEQLGLSENTLVFFCSDNGGNQNGDNGPLRGFKGQIWEGGHRVPAIAYWPGTIPAGQVTDATALSMDLFPTLLEAAGIDEGESLELDGVSLMPVFTGAGSLPERPLFWDVGGGRAVRLGQWKLVLEKSKAKSSNQQTKPAAYQLYDLSQDLGEAAAVDNAEVTQELKTLLKNWLKSWADVEQRS